MTDGLWFWLIIGAMICVTGVIGLVRLIRCPSNRLLLVRNRLVRMMGWNAEVDTRHGGMHFVWPFLQEYRFLDLSPMKISVDLTGFVDQEVRDPSTYYFKACLDMGSKEELQYAGNQFWSLNREQIQQELKEQIEETISQLVSSKDGLAINGQRNDFLVELEQFLNQELADHGFELLTISHKP